MYEGMPTTTNFVKDENGNILTDFYTRKSKNILLQAMEAHRVARG
jgi:hypothetical protein